MKYRPALLVSILSTACSVSSHDSLDPDSGAAGHDVGSPTVGHDAGAVSRDGGPVEESSFNTIPSPALLIANGGNSTLSIIDPETLVVVSTVAVMTGLHPHHISVSPDGARALITATSADLSLGHGAGAHAGHGGGAVSTVVYQLDIASRELREVITLDATAHNAAFTKDGATVVLAMMEHGMIAGYDATTFTETFTAMGFMMPLEVTPTGTGTLLVAESGASRVSVFDLGSRTISNQFEVGAVPVAAWASGGSAYFVSVEEGMQVRHLVEGDAGVTLDEHIVDPEGMPGQAVLTPNGDELWVAVEDRGVLALFGATTHEKLAEIAAGMKPHGIVFEPSGERAFVTDEDGGKLLIIDVAARSISSELPLGGKPNGIVWLERQ